MSQASGTIVNNCQPEDFFESETGMILQLADATIAACNETAQRLLGYTAEQLIGQTSFDPLGQAIHADGTVFLPNDYPPSVALRTGQPCLNVSLGFFRPSGELVWLKLDSQPLFRDTPAPYAVVTTIGYTTQPKYQPTERQQSEPQSVQSDDKPQRTILIVDDSPEDRESYRRYLRTDPEYNYVTVEAELGNTGLWQWQQCQPDLILLDYCLPDLDGLEFVSRLQQHSGEATPPIIMLTGQGNELIAVQAIKAGVFDYLVKGQVTSDKLRLTVSWAIKNAQVRARLRQIEAERQQRIEQEQLVLQIAQNIRRSLKLDDILQTTVDEVRHLLETDRVLMFRLQPDGQGTIVVESVGADWTALLSTAMYDPCLSETYIEPFRQGLVTAKTDIYDGSVAPCHVELLAQLQVRANLVVPILQGNHLWGLLIAHHCASPRQWQPLEINLLSSSATQVGIALQQATLYQQAQDELAERQLTAAALRQSEEFVRQQLAEIEAIYTAAPIGLCFINTDLRFVRINEQLAQINGLAVSEHIGRTVRDILPEMADQLEPLYRQVIESGEPILNLEVQGTNSAQPGVERSWLVNYYPQKGADARVVGVNVMVQEITMSKKAQANLQQSEARYRYLVESIPQLVWTADPDGTLLDVNQPWLDYTGLTLGQAQIEGWQAIVHSEDLPHLTQQWLAAQEMGTQYQAEGRMRRTDGVYRWHLHKAIPQKNEQGQVIKWFGTATDIHDRVQFEIERDRILKQEQAAREEAERANRLKDEFLAVLSHELRTPLNPILGWVKLMQTRKFDAAKTAEVLAIIERNAKLQAQLIEDLLNISRIMRGKLTLDSAPVSLAFVISAALETVHLAAEAKKIQLNLTLESSNVQVFGDAGRLQQAIWNLLSNAVKFTPTEGQVTIRLTQVEHHAQIQVIDTGIGISTEFLPYVFEYFRQEDGSTTRKFGGLGLGLAIARQIVEMHGGTIWADSLGVGQGATFTVQLPLLQTEILPQPQPAAPSCRLPDSSTAQT